MVTPLVIVTLFIMSLVCWHFTWLLFLSLLTKMESLTDFGYAVIDDILTAEESDKFRTAILQWLDNFDHKDLIWNGKKGILRNYKSLTHHQAVWDIRQHPNVHKAFSEIWGTKDLIVSYDAVGIQLPPEQTKLYSNEFGDWRHIDQGNKKRGFMCIQGFINLEDTDEQDGCLVVRPKSHTKHDEFMNKYGNDFKDDFCLLNKEHLDFYQDYKPIRVKCKKGSLVLWDSRTVHANATAQLGRSTARHRVVVYVCMTPKSFCSKHASALVPRKSDLDKKLKYFNAGRTTNHWPHGGRVTPEKPHFITTDQLHGLEIDKNLFSPPILTDLGKSLIGL